MSMSLTSSWILGTFGTPWFEGSLIFSVWSKSKSPQRNAPWVFSPLVQGPHGDLLLTWDESHSSGYPADFQSYSRHQQSTDLLSKMHQVGTVFHNVSHLPPAWVVLKKQLVASLIAHCSLKNNLGPYIRFTWFVQGKRALWSSLNVVFQAQPTSDNRVQLMFL